MKKSANYLALFAVLATGLFYIANIAFADINVESENNNSITNTNNITTEANATAIATGGSAVVINGGGSCSDCDDCSDCGGYVGGSVTATGGSAYSTSGASSNVSQSQSISSDSEVKVEIDKDGHKHYYKKDKDGHKRYSNYKILPATGSNPIALAGIAVLAVLATAGAVKCSKLK